MHSHLRRLTRVFSSHPVYFVTTNTAHRREILACEQATEILISEWKDARRRHGWGIGRYVIMPDHVHFFCAEMPVAPSPPGSAPPATVQNPAVAGGADPGRYAKRLQDFMQAWKEWTSKGISRAFHLPPPIWQEEYFDHVLRSDESYADKWSYVRENPVRIGLVVRAEQWPWQGFVDFDSPLDS